MDFRNFNESAKYFEKALRIDPTDIKALEFMGHVLADLKKYEEAITYYDKVLEIDPRNAIKFSKDAALSTLELKEYYETHGNLLNMDSMDKDELLDEGFVFSEFGNYSEAIRYFDKALTKDPVDPLVLNNRGDTSFQMGNYSDALKYYDKVLTIYPKETTALERKGDVLFTMGNYSESVKYYDKLLPVDPNYQYTMVTKKAYIMNEMGNKTGYLSYLHNIHDTDDPSSINIANKIGLVYLNQKNYSEAIRYYNHSLDNEQNGINFNLYYTDYMHYWENKGFLLSKLGNYTGSIEMYDKVLEINPNDTMALALKGDALYNLGIYDGAISLYNLSLIHNPDNQIVKEMKDKATNKINNL
ncbi:MAG: tetratricopeptide repeat protein [Thermoproteota archaeon]|nr:tetratricopeptide repeat protein [Thermoproteota archaeon]